MKSTDMVYIKLRVSEATRRELRMLAAETGTSMSNLVEAWVSDEWKHSSVFQKRMLNEGRWWYDSDFRRHRPDGSLADGQNEGGAR